MPRSQQRIVVLAGDQRHFYLRVCLARGQHHAIHRCEVRQALDEFACRVGEFEGDAGFFFVDQTAPHDRGFFDENLRQLARVGVDRPVRAALGFQRHVFHGRRQAVGVAHMGENGDRSDADLVFDAVFNQIRPRTLRVAVADDDDVFLPRVRLLEARVAVAAVDGDVEHVVKTRHIAKLHLLDRRRDFAAIALLLEGKIPLAPPAAGALPGVAEHADFVARGKRFAGFDGALLAPIVAVGHFAGMHRQHQRAFGHLPLSGNIHVDRQNFFQTRPLPPAGTERVFPADHHQPAAHVVYIGREHFLLVFA